jgi:NTP pyrophosphatase (non-canonical NTP hydrolase)
MSSDSYRDMLAVVQAFHDKHNFKNTGGEDLPWRISLMVEELGEIAACVTKNRGDLAEECADLLILLMGTAIAGRVDLQQAFWEKMEKLQTREARMINGRIRISNFKDSQ